jgi:PAS domain S-box-containing protein
VNDGRTKERALKPEISDIPYKALVLHAPHGIFVTDKHGNFIFVNQAASLATGSDQEDLRSMNLVDLIHPDDRECALRHLSEVENTGTAVGEMRYITKSGNTRYCEFKAVHISDECLLAFTSDITQKQHALDDSARKAEELKAAFEELSSTEEELKQQLEEIQAAQNEIEERDRKYRLLFNTSEAGVALHEIICDDTGTAVDYRFLEVNAAFERLTGLAGKEIIGKTVREVACWGRTVLDGDVWACCPDWQTYSFENYSRELGKYYEVTAYSPTKGQFVTIFYDISDRKRQEIQLEETNSLLESLITAANVPILVWDRSCTIIRLNHACEELIGRPADEMVGRHLNVLFPPLAYELSMRLIQTTLAGVRWEEAEIPILHRSGAVKVVFWEFCNHLYQEEILVQLSPKEETSPQNENLSMRKRSCCSDPGEYCKTRDPQ